jgi:hypothetical protein
LLRDCEIAVNFTRLTKKDSRTRTTLTSECFSWFEFQASIQEAIDCAICAHQVDAAILLFGSLPKYRVYLPLPDQDPSEYLVEAIAHDHLELVKLIISRECNSICHRIVSTGYFPGVIYAIKNGHYDIVRYLLEIGYVKTSEMNILGVAIGYGDGHNHEVGAAIWRPGANGALALRAERIMQSHLFDRHPLDRRWLAHGRRHLRRGWQRALPRYLRRLRTALLLRSLGLTETSPLTCLDKAMASTQVALRTSTRSWL